MLDSDYQQHLGTLIKSLEDEIELPPELSTFFDESGAITPLANDRRRSVRTRVRTRCIVVPEYWLPAFPRCEHPELAYTKDFSKTGFGFLFSHQLYPGEHVRVLLATFWMEVRICRCRRLGVSCFETGGELVHMRQPSEDAFDFDHPREFFELATP